MGVSGLGALLVKEGFLTESDYLVISRTSGQTAAAFAKGVLATGMLDESELAAFLSERTRYDQASKDLLADAEPSAMRSIDTHLMQNLEIFPLAITEKGLKVAMVDPLDKGTLRQLEFFSGYSIIPIIATVSQVFTALKSSLPKFEPPQSELSRFIKNHASAALHHIKLRDAKTLPPPQKTNPEDFSPLEAENQIEELVVEQGEGEETIALGDLQEDDSEELQAFDSDFGDADGDLEELDQFDDGSISEEVEDDGFESLDDEDDPFADEEATSAADLPVDDSDDAIELGDDVVFDDSTPFDDSTDDSPSLESESDELEVAAEADDSDDPFALDAADSDPLGLDDTDEDSGSAIDASTDLDVEEPNLELQDALDDPFDLPNEATESDDPSEEAASDEADPFDLADEDPESDEMSLEPAEEAEDPFDLAEEAEEADDSDAPTPEAASEEADPFDLAEADHEPEETSLEPAEEADDPFDLAEEAEEADDSDAPTPETASEEADPFDLAEEDQEPEETSLEPTEEADDPFDLAEEADASDALIPEVPDETPTEFDSEGSAALESSGDELGDLLGEVSEDQSLEAESMSALPEALDDEEMPEVESELEEPDSPDESDEQILEQADDEFNLDSEIEESETFDPTTDESGSSDGTEASPEDPPLGIDQQPAAELPEEPSLASTFAQSGNHAPPADTIAQFNRGLVKLSMAFDADKVKKVARQSFGEIFAAAGIFLTDEDQVSWAETWGGVQLEDFNQHIQSTAQEPNNLQLAQLTPEILDTLKWEKDNSCSATIPTASGKKLHIFALAKPNLLANPNVLDSADTFSKSLAAKLDNVI